MVVGLFGNKNYGLNKIILVTLKSEHNVRLQAALGSHPPTDLPVGAVIYGLPPPK